MVASSLQPEQRAIITRLINPCWQPCYRPSYLGDGLIHLWKIPRQPTRLQLSRTLPLLSAEEIARADRFLRPEDRQAYIHCRGMMRQLLGNYAKLPGSDLTLGYGSSGKPRLCRQGAEYEFNLSHSGEFALLGVSRGIPLGIDIEQLRPRSNMLKLAHRVFDPGTCNALTCLPPYRRLRAFYLAWTSLEAGVKARGEALFANLGVKQGASLDVVHFLPASGYCAALAYAAQPVSPHLAFFAIPNPP